MRKSGIGAALLLFCVLSLVSACAGRQLATESADARTIQGIYSLYLYGCHYPDDIENAAFMISESSPYPFDLYAPETSYTVKKGLPAEQALTEANTFIRCGIHSVWQTGIVRIMDDRGGTVGYEIRPLYYPYDVGFSDVLLFSYSLNKGRVTAYIRPTRERDRDSSPFQDQDSQ
jgi:hypothetical protein